MNEYQICTIFENINTGEEIEDLSNDEFMRQYLHSQRVSDSSVAHKTGKKKIIIKRINNVFLFEADNPISSIKLISPYLDFLLTIESVKVGILSKNGSVTFTNYLQSAFDKEHNSSEQNKKICNGIDLFMIIINDTSQLPCLKYMPYNHNSRIGPDDKNHIFWNYLDTTRTKIEFIPIYTSNDIFVDEIEIECDYLILD